jgi:hypothetical protein
VSKLSVFVVLCILTTTSSASIKDDLQDVTLSLIDVVHRALLRESSFEDVVVDVLEAKPDKAAQVVAAAIAVSPGSISDIVEIALAHGVNPEVIAQHCRSALTLFEIEQIVTSSMKAKARPESILGTCLAVVPEQELSRMLASALTSAESSMHTRIVESVYDVAETMDFDAINLVEEGILLSGVQIDDVEFLVVDELVVDGETEPEAAAQIDFEEQVGSGS